MPQSKAIESLNGYTNKVVFCIAYNRHFRFNGEGQYPLLIQAEGPGHQVTREHSSTPLLWRLLRGWPAFSDALTSHLLGCPFWVLARTSPGSSTLGLGSLLDPEQQCSYPHPILAMHCGSFFFLSKLLPHPGSRGMVVLSLLLPGAPTPHTYTFHQHHP